MEKTAKNRQPHRIRMTAGDPDDGVGITTKNEQAESPALRPGRARDRLPSRAGQKAILFEE
eukprot:7119687-Pyramimonas_sp.AAC.1